MTVHPVSRGVCCEWQNCIPYCLLRNFMCAWVLGLFSCFWFLFKNQFQWNIGFFIYGFEVLSCIHISVLWTVVAERAFLYKLLHYHILKYIRFQIIKIPKHKMIHMYVWALLGAKLAVLIPCLHFLRRIKRQMEFCAQRLLQHIESVESRCAH